MKKLLKRSLLSILALFMLFTFTPLASNKVYAKSDSIIDINDSDDFDLTPAYVSDVFFWDFSAHYSTWSYKDEGNWTKFKVKTDWGIGERTIWINNINNRSECSRLKELIRSIYKTEYNIIAHGGLSIGNVYLMLQTGGITAFTGYGAVANASGFYNNIKNLYYYHGQAMEIARRY